ncbi:DinB superfamily protein [Alteribacillus persepolensis]|uniref:DinB superfamily protein n=1 Tax=Alteribacillus persepolensis TaxID=568899 RepID=A0A1G8EEM8_9BACI|nr:DinB family protein [Alteribacillus persepolensis]SDH68334.1 DinB superfamily protein [Alteribacillus persepolensis]
MATAAMNENIKVFKQGISDIVEVLNKTDESVLYVKPSEKEWSAMQIAAHVVEAVDFWVDDLEALLIVPDGKWGRNHEHVHRLVAVKESVVDQLKREDVIEDLQNLVPKVEAALSKVKEEDLDIKAPSYNPNFDGKPLSFLIDHLIVQHVVGHHDQILRHLAKVQ